MARALKAKKLAHLAANREGSTYRLQVEDEADKKALFELTSDQALLLADMLDKLLADEEEERPRPPAHQAPSVGQDRLGTVKWYNVTKGFGFVIPDGGGDELYLHRSRCHGRGGFLRHPHHRPWRARRLSAQGGRSDDGGGRPGAARCGLSTTARGLWSGLASASWRQGIGAAFEAAVEVDMRDIFSVLRNHDEQTAAMGAAATELFGTDNVAWLDQPRMGSEDFADMLGAVPGAYVWLGQTPGPGLHNPAYRFDDAILALGAALLARMVETRSAG
jgi:Peptidase family M20/M25/M40/'Cold-shock' DNA-binding domain